ncbi:MAG: redox-regulated ATPase YchF [Thermoplasmata archaeon]|nr:redox-regulated ATPase YchF [Thermoplasmata archaeon]
MEFGLVGKPNVGKSTFFAAATLVDAEIASYPFTTIDANRGVTYVRSPCPHTELGKQCDPVNSKCDDGTRMIPVQAIDVAGLVAGAHKGRGRGNQFLDDLRQASVLVHVVDASGETDGEGNLVGVGAHDPREDVGFLEDEIAYWIKGILDRGWDKVSKQIELTHTRTEIALQERLAGLGVTQGDMHQVLDGMDLPEKVSKWTPDQLMELSREVRKVSKPILIAANKADKAPPEMLQSLMDLDDEMVIPTSAECELALRKADKAGLIDYHPGDADFEIKDPSALSGAQTKGLERIRTCMANMGGTGVQKVIEKAVFDMLDSIVVYPVEDETHWASKKGHLLPDAYLVRRGATARDLAYIIHSEFGEKFIRAVNARTRRVVGADYELQENDIVKIVWGG